MTQSFLSSFGFTLDTLDSFGFGGSEAAAVFGAEAVKSFIAAEANLTNIPTNVNLGELFSFAQKIDTANASMGMNSNAQQQLLDVETLLNQQTGASLNDINFSTDGSGNVTASIAGIPGATNTINLNDLLAEALDMVQMA